MNVKKLTKSKICVNTWELWNTFNNLENPNIVLPLFILLFFMWNCGIVYETYKSSMTLNFTNLTNQ